MNVSLFAPMKRNLTPLLKKHRLELANGMKVRIFGHLDYYAPNGRLGLKMAGIDPRFTLGELSQARDQVVRRLIASGLFDANRRHHLSSVPLRVGVVTSVGTAAWHDFHDEIERSGLGFHLAVSDTRVQGEWAAESVAASIRTLGARHRRRLRGGDPRRWRSERAGDVRPRDDRVGDRNESCAGADRSRSRGRPQRRRRRGAHCTEDADGLCRPPRRSGRGLSRPGGGALGSDRRGRPPRHRRGPNPIGRPCAPGRSADPCGRRAGRRASDHACRTPPPCAGAAAAPVRRRPRSPARSGRDPRCRSCSRPNSVASSRSLLVSPPSIRRTCCDVAGASRARSTATWSARCIR